MDIINPATEKLIRSLQEDSEDTIRGKFKIAKEAQSRWQSVPLDQRLKVIDTFKSLLQERTEELAEALTEEVGKPITQSKAEIKGTVERIDYFLKMTPSLLQKDLVTETSASTQEVVERDPLGVIANISARNYPYFVGSNVFIPALLCGNAVLYKPSEYASLTGLSIHSLMDEAGLPDGLFNVVIGRATEGSLLLETPINGVFFTGSYATAQKIATTCGPKMIRTQFECGGKDPSYVCDDAPVESSAESLCEGSFFNAGQSCCAVERIYVHEAVYDDFLESFIEKAKLWTVGPPTDAQTQLGPLTRKEQIAVIQDQIQDAFEKGAKIALGGKSKSGPGNFFEATVLTNVNHEMKLMREESFGPVIGIQKVKNDHEAIEKMNDTQYGLTAGVYSSDQSRAETILRSVNSGTSYWNCCDRVSPTSPWSGRNHSGLGATLGKEGILNFTRPKAFHFRSPV